MSVNYLVVYNLVLLIAVSSQYPVQRKNQMSVPLHRELLRNIKYKMDKPFFKDKKVIHYSSPAKVLPKYDLPNREKKDYYSSKKKFFPATYLKPPGYNKSEYHLYANKNLEEKTTTTNPPSKNNVFNSAKDNAGAGSTWKNHRPYYVKDHSPENSEEEEEETSKEQNKNYEKEEAQEESENKSEPEKQQNSEDSREEDMPFSLSPTGERVDFQIQGQNGPDTYIFGFDTGDGKNRQYRLEERLKDGTVVGQYGYYDATGKLRAIKYIADPIEGYQEKHHESNSNSEEAARRDNRE